MSRSLRTQAIAFAFIRTVINTMHRMVYPFLPVFSRGLGVDFTALSLALTGRQFMGVLGPFSAILLENRGRKTGLLVGLGLFTSGVTLVVLRPTYPIFILSLVMTTLGKYMFDPHMQGYLSDRVPYERRGLVLAITELGWSLSFILGVPIMGFMIARGGWMSPFGILSLLGLISILIIRKIIPPTTDDRMNWDRILENCRLVFRYPPTLTALAIGLAISAANEIINLVFGVWLEDSFGLQILALGGAAAAIGLSELSGETLMGVITDRLGKTRSIQWGIIVNCLVTVLFPVLGRTLPGSLVALFLFYLSFEFTLVATIPFMTEILPTARVTIMAFNVASLSLGRAIGALAASPLYRLGISSSSLAAIGFNIVAFLCLHRIQKGKWREKLEVVR